MREATFIGASYCPVCKRLEREVIQPMAEKGFAIRAVDGMKEAGLARKLHIEKVPVIVLTDGDRQVIISDVSMITEPFLTTFLSSDDTLDEIIFDWMG